MSLKSGSTVLVDMDEVLTNCVTEIINKTNTHYNTNYKLSDVKGWDFEKFLGKRSKSFLYDEGFFEQLLPLDGAIEGFHKLYTQYNLDVVIATAIPEHSSFAASEKIRWVKKYLPSFPIKNIFICDRKNMIKGDLIFDDGLHNLKSFDGIRVCYDKPWNQTDENIVDHRVKNWNEFLNLIEKNYL